MIFATLRISIALAHAPAFAEKARRVVVPGGTGAFMPPRADPVTPPAEREPYPNCEG